MIILIGFEQELHVKYHNICHNGRKFSNGTLFAYKYVTMNLLHMAKETGNRSNHRKMANE